MKNKAFLNVSILFLSSLLVGSLFINKDIEKVDAAYETKQVFNDKFDDDEINDNWTVINDMTLKQHYSSMRFTPNQYSWSNVLSYHEKLSGDYKISIELETSSLRGWFAIGLGNLFTGSAFSGSKAGFVFYDNNYSQILSTESGKLDANGSYAVSPFGFDLNVKRTVEIDVKYINENHSSMQCSVYEKNVLLGSFFNEPYVTDNLDGYFGFNINLKQVEIYNVKIYSGDSLVYEDDFSTSKILYPSSGSINSEWHANGFKEDEVKVGFVNSLFADDINSGVIYKNPLNIPENKELDIAYIIETDIQFYPMDYDVVSGIEISKKNADLRGYFFGIERLFIGYSLCVYGPDNTLIHSENTQNENVDLSVHLRMEIYLNGDISISTDDLSFNVHIDDYEGYFGLMTYSFKNLEHGKGAYFKSFRLYRDNYYKRDSQDLFLNFNGIKKTYFEDIDEYAYDYYLSKKNYDIGTNVALSKWQKKDNGNGRLEFNNSTQTSFFGPKTLYKDFIIKFDVQINNLEVPHGGCLGIKFGNSMNGLTIDNSKSIGIGYYPTDDGVYHTVPYITNVDYTVDASTTFTDKNGEMVDIFKDNNKFTLMFICRNNEVSLHYLLEDEDEMSLSKARTKVTCRENESTDGYLSIYGSYGISFSVDNLSIINLDIDAPSSEYAGKTDYQEVTRLDFSNSSNVEGLELKNAAVSNNTLAISENGSVTTSKLVTDGILRLKIKGIERELEIKQDDLDIKIVNENSPYISITDGAIEQRFELGSSFELSGSLFEFEKFNNHLDIHYLSGNEPLSMFENNVVTFNVDVSNYSTKLEIISNGGSASLDSMAFINLNKYASFVNYDYDESTDYFDPWPEKEPMKDDSLPSSGSKGCGGSIKGSSLIAMAISLVGLVVISLRRRAKDEK